MTVKTQRAAGTWKVSTRPFDAVTVTKVSVPELTVVLFTDATRPSSDQQGVQDRLRALVDEALQTPPPTMGRRVIPHVAHQVVRSLLEWQEELELEGDEPIFLSLVFSHSTSAPAIVHIGGDEPRFETPEGPMTPQGLVLRGPAAGQARALCMRAGSLPRISMTWSALVEAHGDGPSVEATWLSTPVDEEDEDAPSDSTLLVDDDASWSSLEISYPDVALEDANVTADEVLDPFAAADDVGVFDSNGIAAVETPTESPTDWLRTEPVDEPGLGSSVDPPGFASSIDDPALASSIDDPELASSSDDLGLASRIDDSELASSVDELGLASSIDDAGLASSVDDPELASSVDELGLASSIDDAGLASSVDHPELASSIDETELASSIDDAGLASSVDEPELASSIVHPELVSSIDELRIASPTAEVAEPEIAESAPREAVESTSERPHDAPSVPVSPKQSTDWSRFLEMDAPSLIFRTPGSLEDPYAIHTEARALEPTPVLEPEQVTESASDPAHGPIVESVIEPKPDPVTTRESTTPIEPAVLRDAAFTTRPDDSLHLPKRNPVLHSVVEPVTVSVPEPKPLSVPEPASLSVPEAAPVTGPTSRSLEPSPPKPVRPLRAVRPMVAVVAPRAAESPRTADTTRVVRPAVRPVLPKTQRSARKGRPPASRVSLSDFAPSTRQGIAIVLGLVLAVVIFVVGWRLGDVHLDGSAGGSPLQALGSRFECRVQSDPDGAAIAVDGQKTGRMTPATLALSTGEHTITIETDQWGAVARKVHGGRGDKMTVDVPLWGSMAVRTPAGSTSVSVWVDHEPRGKTPVTIGHLEPGPHEVRFSKPGVTAWERTVEVPIQGTVDVVADPFVVPATGSIEIRATWMDDTGIEKPAKANVWVDSKPNGMTPLTLELPHGPHSIRASHRDEDSPVTVLNLPGGNKRFVNMRFGTGVVPPRLTILEVQTPADKDGVIRTTAELSGVRQSELKEMWLYARDRDQNWHRYPMSLLAVSGGTMGVAVLPAEVMKPRPAPYYVSALTNVGDEYFTEMQNPDALKSSSERRGPPATR